QLRRKLGRLEFLAAFQSYFSPQILAIATDARDRGQVVGRSENHGGGLGSQVAGYSRAIFAAPVTHIMDVQVKMIAPEKWRHDERFARAEHIPSSSLALSLRNDPVLHSDTACAGIGPACDVAGSKYSRHVRL